MRVNVYAEEMTDRIEIISKKIDGHKFTGLRFYLELPASTFKYAMGSEHLKPSKDVPEQSFHEVVQITGPFIHRPGDDDSAAVTFWGKRDLREVLRKALAMLDAHYEQSTVVVGLPCPNCNPSGVFNYGDERCELCRGTAHLPRP